MKNLEEADSKLALEIKKEWKTFYKLNFMTNIAFLEDDIKKFDYSNGLCSEKA